MKTKILTLLALTLFSCSKKEEIGCIYGSSKTNYVERIKLVKKGNYTDYILIEAGKKYRTVYFVKSADCNCPEYLD